MLSGSIGIANIGLKSGRHLSTLQSAKPNPSNATRGEILCSRVGRPAGEKVPWPSLSLSFSLSPSLFPTETTHAMQVRTEERQREGREGRYAKDANDTTSSRSVAGRQWGRKGRKACARARDRASERPQVPTGELPVPNQHSKCADDRKGGRGKGSGPSTPLL